MNTIPMPAYQALRDRLVMHGKFLIDKPEETADSTLCALWFCAAGEPKSAELALTDKLPALTPHQLDRLNQLVSQRIDGVPLSHLTGRQRFMGMEMLAGPDALVPRKETELLGRVAIELAETRVASNVAPLVIDICTGSGNVALAVAHHVPTSRVLGADLSEAAVLLARRNAKHLGLEAQVEFRAGDLLAPFESAQYLGQVDLLTCNPPYINSAKVPTMPKEISAHEPHLAFDGGALGIGILMRLIRDAPRFLRAGGWLAFEVGAGQGPALVKRLNATSAFTQVNTSLDHTDVIRVIYAQR